MTLTVDLTQHASSPERLPELTPETVVVIVIPPRPATSRPRSLSPEPADHSAGLSPAEREAVTWHDAEWQ
jgi:hypothetical protein